MDAWLYTITTFHLEEIQALSQGACCCLVHRSKICPQAYLPFILKTLSYLIELCHSICDRSWATQKGLTLAPQGRTGALQFVYGCESHPKPKSLGSQSEICLLNREALPSPCSAKSGYFKEKAEHFCLKRTRHMYRGWEFRSKAQVLIYGEVLCSLFFPELKRKAGKCLGAKLCKICGPEWQTKSYTASCGKISGIKGQKSGLWASQSKSCNVLSSCPRKSSKCALKIWRLSTWMGGYVNCSTLHWHWACCL